ncbi:MAG TPA: response regulator [Anaerolineales bacterium]|nr:response regulator [Anaerolineales bacterium]
MSGKTILLLDENEASRKFLAATLRQKQFNVIETSLGKEALIYAWRDHPDLILFDPVMSDLRGEEFIQKLRQDARTQKTPILALSSDPSPVRRQACLEAGATEYMVKSPDALRSLESAIWQAFSEETAAEEIKREKALMIVFLSAKGGTGTSSLCANLAMNFTKHQPEAQVVVADLVLPIGSIAPIVGYEGDLNLVTVADLPSAQTTGKYFLENLPRPELWQFQLLAGSPDPRQANKLNIGRVHEIMEVLRSAYDIVVVDLGRSLSRISMPFIQHADLICLVVATDLSTIKLTKTVWDYLQTQGIDERRVYAILNRAVGLEGLTKTEAEAIIGIPIKTTVPYMGGNFTLANNLNQPITVKYPKDTSSMIFNQTSEDMLKLARQLRMQAR